MLRTQLDELRKKLLEFSSLVETIIEKTIKGLKDADRAAFDAIVRDYEPQANQMETAIDEVCLDLIAKYQPAAVDLRLILMVLKMNNDLERMADHAVNIAESGAFLIQQPKAKIKDDLTDMAQTTLGMLKNSINAFVSRDVKLAMDVCLADNTVDNIMDQLYRQLIAKMESHSVTIERSMHQLRIAHNYERIADLSTNIAEDVIFLAEGKVIKHHKND